jgi:hypothetical protein
VFGLFVRFELHLDLFARMSLNVTLRGIELEAINTSIPRESDRLLSIIGKLESSLFSLIDDAVAKFKLIIR